MNATEGVACVRQRDGLLWRAATIGVALFVAVGGLLLVLTITALATFFVGPFSLLIPLGALFAAIAALSTWSQRTRAAEWCPECGGVLSAAVIEAARIDDSGELRLRAVYTCAVVEHRSWRWADEGGPLRAEGASSREEPREEARVNAPGSPTRTAPGRADR
ncbi:hypothetical protein ABH931_005548 [Streptacidiphilus sp. MAP12-33]|uniref:hypothetical protein n=1 Tax=Streptacidiphilus sp. MAP12-33 TaxID=3156266 RepID=UPI003514EC3D